MLRRLRPELTRAERAYSIGICLVGPFVSFLDTLSIVLSASLVSLLTDAESSSVLGNWFPSAQLSTATVLMLFLVVFLTRSIFRSARVVLEANLRRRVCGRLSMRIFEQQLSRHGFLTSSRDSSEMVRDLDAVPLYVNSYIFSRYVIFEEIILGIGVLLLLASQSTIGTIVVLVLGGALLFGSVRTSSLRLQDAGTQAVAHRAKRLQFALFVFRSIREMLVYGKQKTAATYFGSHLNNALDAERRYEIISRTSPVIIESIVVLSAVSTLWLTSALLEGDAETLTIGVVLALGSFRLVPSLSRLAHALQDRRFASTQAEILSRYLTDTPALIVSADQETDTTEKQRAIGSIIEVEPEQVTVRLENVTFSYGPNLPVILDKVSHVFESGLLHVIQGESGRGKSTVLSLVLGIAEPQSGKILVNNIPLKQSPQYQLHQIAYVPQSVAAVDYSIAENISLEFGSTTYVPRNRLLEAVRAAGLEDFVSTLPNGLETSLGELGSKVSGGQLQRIGLARALYRNPKILLLDEVTSNLDSETEIKILSDLAKLKSQILMIVVSHSHQVAEYADRQLVLR